MDIRDAVSSSTLVKFALVLWFISAIFIVFMLGQIDQIVHVQLYHYGLQFNQAWANPYWTSLRTVYVALILPSVFAGGLLVLNLVSGRGNRLKVVTRKEEKSAASQFQPVTPTPQQNNLLASCPSCKKVFTKPLAMLDFSQGKTRLVNVCPYCNHILGSADADDDTVDVMVPHLREEKPQQ
jgi:hypothetical protein